MRTPITKTTWHKLRPGDPLVDHNGGEWRHKGGSSPPYKSFREPGNADAHQLFWNDGQFYYVDDNCLVTELNHPQAYIKKAA